MRARYWEDWAFYTVVTVMCLIFVGLIGFAACSAVGDQRARDACVASHGQITAPDHGDGWSCVHKEEK